MKDLIEICAGGLRLYFDQRTLFVRRIEWEGEEMVRAIYGAVRDRNWGTIEPIATAMEITEKEGRYSIHFTAECKSGGIDFLWEGKISVSETQIQFTFNGHARSEFLRNRIGLCVLHPIELCSGWPCAIEHTSGETDQGAFPLLISPFQPFFDICKISYASKSARVQIEFEGEVFEMEDQRNWSDASFKTYGTPLGLPFPKLVTRGEVVQQSVTVQFSPIAAGSTAKRKNTEAVHCDFARTFDLPLLGFESSGSESTGALLSSVAPDHLRVDCIPARAGWEQKLHRADREAYACNAGLHIAAFLGLDKERDLLAIQSAAAQLKSPVKLWLIFDAGRHVTSPETISLARRILKVSDLAAGTDENFTELNRERPAEGSDWFPCFSFNPQVHAFDDLSLIENIEAVPDVVRTAATVAPKPLVISTITLLPRTVSATTEADGQARRYDRRQASPLIAGWTIGVLNALSTSGAVRSATFFETIGPGGVIGANGAHTASYAIFEAISRWKKVAHVKHDKFGWPKCSALAGIDHNNRKLLLIANLTSEKVEIEVRAANGASALKIRELNTGDYIESTANIVRLSPGAVRCVEFDDQMILSAGV